MRRASFWPIAILAIVFTGIVGVVLFRVAADQKPHDQKPHNVVLKWNPPVPKPGTTVAGYNVYRSESHGPFQKVAYVVPPTYTDDKVSSGKTYGYFVRAVDPAGQESPTSNLADAAIP
ncbi:MAG: fibronectin type III domain-containing protein [Terriglobales bacterium]